MSDLMALADQVARASRIYAAYYHLPTVQAILGFAPGVDAEGRYEFSVTQWKQIEELLRYARYPSTTPDNTMFGIPVVQMPSIDDMVAAAIDRINARAAFLLRQAEERADLRHGMFTRHLLRDLSWGIPKRTPDRFTLKGPTA